MPDEQVPPWEGDFRILSLDGGGIRGLFAAAVLAHLEQDLQIQITDHFDLITGTSTGGIIAIGLGLGMRPKALVDFYTGHGPAIFPSSGICLRRWLRFLYRTLWRHRYDSKPLESALRTAIGERLFGESTKRLVIPSYDLGHDQVRVFRTPHHSRLRRDWQFPAWKVAMATTAAPTYFPAWKGIEKTRLVDGGVWANNPTLVGLVEATSTLNVPWDAIRILSIGTCDDVTRHPDRLDSGGLIAWRTAGVNVAMRGQSVGTNNMVELLLGRDRVHRLDPRVPMGVFALDKCNTDEHLAIAARESLHFCPRFNEVFRPHIAKPYYPSYPVPDYSI
ncbi:CBASS cGAMP-activated phospholipase [Botrimarina mediterranea]|uniref:Patatin-like phospholipase n=1 Tax=Botrimarina mediterranea TaxID=2528022 RepID=A0A518K7E5_9BACT|nr:CBASS cGAMP-activated phospholipase [Botrimarina mediterranea]QDV73721.1 Patatin-like phospholipase [Botrimarina mediterranea]